MSKTFTPLNPSPAGVKIVQCSAVLPNKCQCWRAGDFLVTEVTQKTSPAHDDVAETTVEVVTKYQLCRMHAVIEDAQQEGTMKVEKEEVKS